MGLWRLNFATLLTLHTLKFALVIAASQDQTFFVGERAELPCVGNIGNNDQYQWFDVTDGGSLQIYVVTNNAASKTADAMNLEKYNNFTVVNDFPTSVNLSINPVALQHIGEYRCQFVSAPRQDVIRLEVEVKPQQKSISCQSSMECPSKDSSIPSEVTCVCTAIGAFPESLQFQWINATGSNTERTESSSGLSGTFDFTSSATVVVDKDNPMVSCNLTGYNSEVDENEMISTYQFSPPSCTLDIDCSKAVITCNCVDASPEDIKYTFYDKDQNILDRDQPTSNQMRVDIEYGEDNTFYCWGCNGIYFGEHSFVNNTVPCPIEPTPSATTPNKTGDADPGTTGSPNGLVIGLSVVGSLIAVAVIVIIILFVLKRWKNPTERKNLATSGGNTNPSYTESAYDEVHKDTLAAKSDKTDGNGMPMSEAPEYAAVDKPLNSEPKPAPRSSQPPPNNSTEKQELQYADIDHSSRTPSNQIRQPAEAPTEYATVQSVIV